MHGCGEANFEVLSNPEFLSEGTTIHDLQYPARVLIGSQQTPAGHEAAATLAQLYEAWVPSKLIKMMDCWSSELSKLAANAMLAQRLSSINSLSSICEIVGGDIDAVSAACGLDPRIGPGMLQSGLGWGGGCFEKDVRGLAYIASCLGLNDVSDYWMSVVEMNNLQKTRFLRRILACMHGSVRRKKIAILGFAFKKNTSDTKGSPAIALVKGLLDEGADVAIYDPMVPNSQIETDLAGQPVRICKTAYEACEQAEAVVVATDWDEFRMAPSQPQNTRVSESGELQCLTPDSDRSPSTPDGMEWERIVQGMQRPKHVFDGRNVLQGGRLETMGCRYVRIGQMSQWDATNRYPFSR